MKQCNVGISASNHYRPLYRRFRRITATEGRRPTEFPVGRISDSIVWSVGAERKKESVRVIGIRNDIVPVWRMKRSVPGTRVPPDIFPVIAHLPAYVGARASIDRMESMFVERFKWPWSNPVGRAAKERNRKRIFSFARYKSAKLLLFHSTIAFSPTVFFFSPFLFNFLSHRSFYSLSTEKPLVQREWLIPSTAGFIAFQLLLSIIDVFIILRLRCSCYVALER